MGKGMVALPQLSGRGSSGATQPTKSLPSLARDTKYELQFGPKDQRALETAFDSYLEYRRKREPLLEDERWRCVLKLQQLVTSRNISLAGREGALYEELHRSCPKRLCERARFLVVMRRVFGFELAPVRGAVDQGTKKLMDNLFDAFDEDGSQPTAGSIERDSCAGDATADDHDVHRRVACVVVCVLVE